MITKDGIKLCSLVIHHQAISEINRACALLFSSCVSIRNSTAAQLFLEKETGGYNRQENKTKQQPAQRQTTPTQRWTVHGEDADAVPRHLPHRNTQLESLLWQQSLAKCFESQCHCLGKTTIRAVLSAAQLKK